MTPRPQDPNEWRVQRRSVVDDDELTPIGSAPTLMTFNGFGFKLYGRSDMDPETGSFMTTHYFVVLFIPLFPTARYRVLSDDGSSYQFLGKGRLRTIDKVHLALFAALVLYFIKNAGLK